MSRIFFDMDGVLNYFEKDKSLEEVTAKGYMLNVVPNKVMLAVAERLSKYFTVCIASSYIYEYAKEEKQEWLAKNAPFIKPENQFYFKYGTNKGEELEKQVEVMTGDIFIDDFTPNLFDMREKFEDMICIKCLNGINDTNKSWDGARISIYSSPKVISNTIFGLWEIFMKRVDEEEAC